MTRDELVEKLAQDMTESLDMDALIEYYYEGTVHFLDALDEESLLVEYNEWFEEEEAVITAEDAVWEELKPCV